MKTMEMLNKFKEEGFIFKAEYRGEVHPWEYSNDSIVKMIEEEYFFCQATILIYDMYECGCIENNGYYLLAKNLEANIEEYEFYKCHYSIDTEEKEIELQYIFHHKIEGICDWCESQKEEWVDAETLAINTEAFEGMNWHHGLVTGFAGYVTEDDLFRNIDFFVNTTRYNLDKHVCTTHTCQCVGPIGLILEGDVKVASNIDLYSRTNHVTGHKEVNINDDRYQDGQIDYPEEFDFDRWSHTEIIIRPRKIKGIWWKVGNNFGASVEKKLKALCKALKIKFYYINDYENINLLEDIAITAAIEEEINKYTEHESLPIHAPMWA